MRVTEKGQVTIPKDIRDRYGIKPGAEVEFVADDKGPRLVLVSASADMNDQGFDEWLNAVSGTLDVGDMTTEDYMEWLRGPRDDVSPH
ncbi:AbrB/MazE/SpoVT family DNA-binding domain-containing protein [Rhizobium sp. C4]|uniref:AbrB/MazE/SpoVT family DNA-binding domain-containing protein n=1 Tax=Rhizobium sp. C4 TaxID=1349800 RepID=UPI001E57A0CF|nr:AbrB/MazE/SpoVT family DNA-binding domain-containing protein [Rhizobium sp. C4]MCD2174118.1 AbrB/MazE/SpoVT family DNA-binding domain-containing protein [Rhizobium sp. C4]